MSDVVHERLPNGLLVAAERVPGARSAAVRLLLPAGASAEPAGGSGAAAVLAHWIARGAGSRDARALSDAMDAIGLDRSFEAETEALSISGTCLARDLPRALDLLADVARRPRLPPEDLEACRALALQALDALEDAPASLCMVELGRRFLPPPLDRPAAGTAAEIRALRADSLAAWARARLGPAAAALGVAGGIDPTAALAEVRGRFGDWAGDGAAPPPSDAARAPTRDRPGRDRPGRYRIERPGAQVQIGVAFEAAPPDSPEADLDALAVQVLSGGMGARLFVEVREKRGLVYAVKAALRHHRGLGAVFAYAGTTPERAGETLRVLGETLDGAAGGATAEEFDRARVRARSGVVMQGESPRARAGVLASDLLLRGRPRPMDEVLATIERATRADLDRRMAALAAAPRTVLTLGPAGVGA